MVGGQKLKLALIIIAALTLASCTVSKNDLNTTQTQNPPQSPASNESGYLNLDEVIPATYRQCINAALGQPIDTKALVAAGFEPQNDRKFVAPLKEKKEHWLRDLNLALVVTYELKHMFGANDGCYIFMQYGNEYIFSFVSKLQDIAKQQGYDLLKLDNSRGVFYLYDGKNALSIRIKTKLSGTPWIEIRLSQAENFTTKNTSPFSLPADL